MVEIRREIDLRSPEFIASTRPLGRAFVKSLLGVLFFFLLAAALYTVHLYKCYLQDQLEAETASLEALREEVKPVLELIGQSALLKARADLERELLKSRKPVHGYLLSARHLAAAHNLELELVAADREDSISLKGRGHALEDIASFSLEFENMPHICTAGVTALNLGYEGDYHFELTATGLKKEELSE